MYIPAAYRQADPEKALHFMREHPFAAIISVADGRPVATHLPFHIASTETGITLSAHFAKANPQWKELREALVIFSGPQAYISPSLYDRKESVPTWNYIAVHAWGEVSIETDEIRGYKMLEDLMEQSEPDYTAQWEQLSPDYKNRLYKGIVPFSLSVSRLEAQEKLSQDRTAAEQQRIAGALGAGGEGARETARYMSRRAGME